MTTLTNLLDRWTNVRARLIETVDKFADTELDFRPFPSAWTVRLLMPISPVSDLPPLAPNLGRV